ncbi:MAG: twin-arginine translocation signal domain-containing protein [Acidobacteriota bacterium]|nr:twin-arginine translocation signal domain-containing protein [Acidobacteriota bacterium]
MTSSLIRRRDFLKQSALAAAALPFAGIPRLAHSQQPAPASTAARPHFPTSDPAWATTWDAALTVLAGNVRSMPRYEHPVLVEGSTYAGIWLECAPQEGQVYGILQKYVATPAGQPTPLETARANHMAFFGQQKPDGQLPASIKLADKVGTDAGYGQIQMVVPIAATAWDIVQLTHDQQLLETAYASCSRWDAWLRQYRDTRKTGLVEGFCTYDTGHDNSPRWAGIPNRCPDADARKFPPLLGMPRICPDLSATVYGGRIALAAMAHALGKSDDHARWLADAEHLRQLILNKLYSPDDAAFYDLDTDNKFIRVRGDLITRVLGEHVVDPHKDKAIFEAVWTRQLHNPKAFWGTYPLASIAMDDPTFVRPIPRNSWGGASQALTALRAPRWMPFYGKQAELDHMMQQWCSAIMRHTEFRQQIDPLSGDFTQPDPGGYSPCALVFCDFARRLSKV